jgi:hypothetical protein
MYKCYICHVDSFDTIERLKFHLEYHKDNGELSMPILCRQSSCKSSFTTLFNFMRHLRMYHILATANGTVHIVNRNVSDDEMDDTIDECVDITSQSDQYIVDFLGDVKTEAVSLVAGLRANSSIPYSIIPDIVQSFNSMTSSVTAYIHSEMESSLKHAGIESETISQVMSTLDDTLENCKQPLDFLSSRYKIDKFFASHPLAVAPESVQFAPRLESHAGRSTFVYDAFQYVPVKKTLCSLLQNQQYVEALLQDHCVPDVISDFADGSRCREHPLFSDCSKFSLKIQLFYDGLGVTNPLRGQSALHNVGVFFYTVKNLPQKFNSSFGNIHLLALCYSHDLAVYGYDPVVQKFVAEMKELSSVGFEGSFPILGRCTVYASLCQVTCDNLALNGLLGFIESFSGDYFCTICYATSREIQTKFREELFCKRTVREYKNDLANLPVAKQGGKNHFRGVKSESRLNEIDGYHVVDNWSLDIMHILLEGIVPVELGCILYGLCVIDKCVTLQMVNREFRILWGKMTVEKTHKPVEITKISEPGHVLSPSMKAVQYYALLKYLPLAIGRHIPFGNKHFKFLLHLSHLVDLVFAQRFTQDIVVYLKNVVCDHLSLFVDLYANDQVRLRPKHHFLVHLPSIIMKSGPLVGMSCMRYELKNSFFKRCAHVVCNFTNICYTLANRHQQFALFSQLSNNHIRVGATVGKHKYDSLAKLDYHDCVQQRFAVDTTEELAVCNKIRYGTVEYKQGHFLLLSVSSATGQPELGRICSVVSLSGDDRWYFVVSHVHTVDFVRQFHAYEIEFTEPPTFAVLSLEELADHHPLHCQTFVVGGVKKRLIRLPYHIF